MEISPAKAEETLKMPISWQIPNATKIFQAARIKGAPVADVAKGSRPHQVFLEMARAVRPRRRGARQAAQGPVRRVLLSRRRPGSEAPTSTMISMDGSATEAQGSASGELEPH